MVLEGRATLLGLRHAGRSPRFHCQKGLSISDNLSSVSAFENAVQEPVLASVAPPGRSFCYSMSADVALAMPGERSQSHRPRLEIGSRQPHPSRCVPARAAP